MCSIALNASRADGRRRFEPSLRYWFCFQPFKASALDWPVIHRHHTCLQRAQHEHFGNGTLVDPLSGRYSRKNKQRRSTRSTLARSAAPPTTT